MRVFETLKLADKVVTFARTAISLLQPDDPLVVGTHPFSLHNSKLCVAVLICCFFVSGYSLVKDFSAGVGVGQKRRGVQCDSLKPGLIEVLNCFV